MKNLVIFLIIFILVLLESTVIPLNLTLVAVIVWATLRPVDQVLFVAFLSGIVLDLFTGRSWGFTSLTFLLSALPIYLYKNRFQGDKLRFLLPYSFLIIFIINFFSGTVSLVPIILGSLSTIFLLPILRILSLVIQEEIQPKLSF